VPSAPSRPAVPAPAVPDGQDPVSAARSAPAGSPAGGPPAAGRLPVREPGKHAAFLGGPRPGSGVTPAQRAATADTALPDRDRHLLDPQRGAAAAWGPGAAGTATEAAGTDAAGTATEAAGATATEATGTATEAGATATEAAGATADFSGDAPAAPRSGDGAAAGPFHPANEVEASLLDARADGSTDAFLSTLLLATVLVPVPDGAPGRLRPGDDNFAWRTSTLDGDPYVTVFTSAERLEEHAASTGGSPPPTVPVRFVRLIRAWPDPTWSFAVNPGSPVGATLPGAQIMALASWAADVGLGAEDDLDDDAPEPTGATRYGADGAAGRDAAPRGLGRPAPPEDSRPPTMQKVVPPAQVAYYLERGYDRVSGFVHRAAEVDHLRTPRELLGALGLRHPGSPFPADPDELYVLRWPAYRPSLYRIPYGGANEAAMRAMEGWVIERAPFRGNGFTPGDSGDVIAEFKVDSARLPHGAQLWRMTARGDETLVAMFDADYATWREVA
ncbi:MAG TPA: SseB family protein, partial [Pilimelia sp.]|nr:SseB family protein [Pilimelia sp.]